MLSVEMSCVRNSLFRFKSPSLRRKKEAVSASLPSLIQRMKNKICCLKGRNIIWAKDCASSELLFPVDLFKSF